MVFVVFRGVLDQDNGAVEIPLHPRSHDHEVSPQVSHPEKLGLEGENRAGLVFSILRLFFLSFTGLCYRSHSHGSSLPEDHQLLP